MPRFDHAQTSFIGGELSPHMWGLIESDLYKSALAIAENWEVIPQHSVMLAPGMQFLKALPGAKRIVPFRRSGQQDLQFVMGGGVGQFYDDVGNALVVITSVNLITNGDFSAGLFSWTAGAINGGVVDTVGGRANLRCPAFVDTASITQNIVLAAPSALTLTWRGGPVNQGESPYLFLRVTNVTTGTILWDGPFQAGQNTKVLNGGLPLSAATYSIMLASSSYSGWVDDVTLSAPGAAITSIPIPWTDDQLSALHWVAETGTDRTVFFHPNVQTWAVQRAPVTGVWTYGAVTFANPPQVDPGAPGAPLWAGTNWPATGEFWQGRLYVGGTPSQGNRLLASKPGSIFDFGLTELVSGVQTVTARMAIDVLLATKGTIQWIRGRYMLLVGTELGEGAVTSGSGGANGGAVTPLDFQYRPESAHGSSPIQADDIGDQVLYVSRDYRKVRACNFVHDLQAWTSLDVTFTGEHITKPLIKEIHFARDPHSTIFLLLQDGTAGACTYDRVRQAAAWWRRTTQGAIRSMSVSHGPSGSIVFLLVDRTGGTYLERMAMSEFDPGRIYLDAAVTLAAPPATTTQFVPTGMGQMMTMDVPSNLVVQGLGHLEGKSVKIILDGAQEADQVVTGGQITLARGGSFVTVGLGYTAKGRSLPPEGGNPKGSSQRMKRRCVRISMRLNDSALPKINGVLIAPDRTPGTSLDTPEPRFTGDIEAVGPTGYDTGVFDFTQDLPFRTEILAMFRLVHAEEI